MKAVNDHKALLKREKEKRGAEAKIESKEEEGNGDGQGDVEMAEEKIDQVVMGMGAGDVPAAPVAIAA